MRPGQLYWLIVGIIILGAVALRTLDPEPVARLRYLVFDTFVKAAPRSYDPDLPIRIINIDEESLSRIGQWPWPRTILADMVEKLKADGAAVIGFDMLFSEPDRLSPGELARTWKTLVDDQLKAEIAKLPSNDTVFAGSMAGTNVVLGFTGVDSGRTSPPQKTKFAFAGDDPMAFVPAYRAASKGIEGLEKVAAGLGSLSWIPDSDQLVRRLPLLVRSGDNLFPAFSAEVLRVAVGASTLVVRSSGASQVEAFGEHTGIDSLKIGKIVVPTDASGRLWLYLTPSDPRRYIPAWQVLEGSVPKAAIEGRIILVGVNAAGLLDLRSTALDSVIAGVEVHAQAIEQMISGEHLYRPDFITGAEILYIIGVGSLVAFIIYSSGAAWGALLGALSLVSVTGASWFAFTHLKWLIDPVYPSLAITVLYIASTVYLYWRTETERRRIQQAFGYYMAPARVNELARRPDKLKLGGEMRDMTLMFLDVRGFTSLADGMDAEEVTSFINRLMTPLSNVIMRERGTIDKYMGDAIMAFWNAPLDDPDHPRNAARASLLILSELDKLNVKWAANGEQAKPVRVGIGLNTGISCVGNLGSEQRFDYSVIGDNVNMASRLEELTKYYGVPIVIGETTAAALADMAILEIDLLPLRGKKQASRIFALLGDEAMRATEDFQALIARHDALTSAYRAGNFADAAQKISLCRASFNPGLDHLYDLYEGRILAFQNVPPPAGWQGEAITPDK